VIEPWAHGTVVRATRYPTYFQYNLVRVEEDPGMSAEALAAFADEALAEVEHRRVDVEPLDLAERLRPDFEAMGWLSDRLVWMRHEAPAPRAGLPIAVEEAPWDAVRDLRVAWHYEDFPQVDLGDHLEEAREVAERRGVRVLAVVERGEPVGWARPSPARRSRPPEMWTTCGSWPTTRAGRSTCMPGSDSVTHGARCICCACRDDR
jgi:hypothetical protein